MKKLYTLLLGACACLSLMSCGEFSAATPSQPQPENRFIDGLAGKSVTLSSAMSVRTLVNDILELEATLPAGSVISVPENAQPINNKYRNEQGKLVFSSTGFIGGVQILSSTLSPKEIHRLNSLETGLYVSAVIADQLQTGLEFPSLTAGTPGEGYTTNYQPSGKPKVSFTKSINTRWPSSVNKAISQASQSSAVRTKWEKIMQELQRVADRTRPMDKSYFMIDPDVAYQQSIDFENDGIVQKKGAWSIAVLGTATRNGFAHVPCAEFMSEVLRQAYKRAGYSHFDDFNAARKNILDFKNGAAAVVNFSDYLAKAGWIPWDPQVYIPPTGAFVMNGSGKSPGHTYMAAGDSGRFIYDNGSPQGRDLRVTSKKIIEMMYQEGVFFLPPGFVPKKWN